MSNWTRTRPTNGHMFVPSKHGRFFDPPRASHRIPKIRLPFDPSDAGPPPSTTATRPPRRRSLVGGERAPPSGGRVFVPLDGYESVEKCATEVVWRVRDVAPALDQSSRREFVYFSTLPDAVRFATGASERRVAPEDDDDDAVTLFEELADGVEAIDDTATTGVDLDCDDVQLMSTYDVARAIMGEDTDECMFVASLGDGACLGAAEVDTASDWLMADEKLDDYCEDGWGSKSAATVTSIGLGDRRALDGHYLGPSYDGTSMVRAAAMPSSTKRSSVCMLGADGPFHSKLSVCFETAALPRGKVKEIVLFSTERASAKNHAALRLGAVACAIRDHADVQASSTTTPSARRNRRSRRAPAKTTAKTTAKTPDKTPDKTRKRAAATTTDGYCATPPKRRRSVYDADGHRVFRKRGRPPKSSSPLFDDCGQPVS